MSRKRYEAEIDEILKKLDGALPRKPLSQRVGGQLLALAQALGHALSSMLGALQAGHLMLLSLALMLAGYLLPVPFSWKRDLGITGLVLFFLALILSLLEKRRPRYEPRWRGRVIRDDQSGWQDWLRRLLGRR